MAKSKPQQPKTLTIDEAAQRVIRKMKPEDREHLKHSDLPAFAYHRGLGMYIRNKYIHGDHFRIDSNSEGYVWCPDSLSMVIVKQVLRLVREG
jgi:hypothetical protein